MTHSNCFETLIEFIPLCENHVIYNKLNVLKLLGRITGEVCIKIIETVVPEIRRELLDADNSPWIIYVEISTR